MKVAEANLNIREVPGPGDNPKIIGWAKRLGGWIASFYKKDSIPWCGLFVGYCLVSAGAENNQNGLGALNWAPYGNKLNVAIPGAILVFKRPGGGHVGFYVSEDDVSYHVLGGNQSDMVKVSRVEKRRLVPGGIRWPKGFAIPTDARPVKKKFDGELSTDEA
jgi:uncharacterized protein (TIGR02594 family)